MGNACGIQCVSGHLRLNLRVGLCGAVQDGHSLGIRNQLLQKVDLLGYRCEIGSSGYISARCIVCLHEAGFCRIRHSRKHDGDLCGSGGSGLGCRCGNGEDQIIAVIHKLLCDGLASRLLAGSVLLVDLIADACIIQCCHKAFIALIQCRMLYQLQDADLIGRAIISLCCLRRGLCSLCCSACCCLFCCRRCCGAACTGTTANHGCCHHCSHRGCCPLLHFHNDPPISAALHFKALMY